MDIANELLKRYEAKLHYSVERAKNTKVVPIIPNHYFATSSSEIRDMYIDGFYIGTISLSQAVAEGLSRFLCKRKHIRCPKNHLTRVNNLRKEKIITEKIKKSFESIEYGRDDFHHMDENIDNDYSALEAKAKLNVDNLFLIEEEIFGCSYDNGKIVPNKPEFWDLNADGTTNVFLRCSI